MAHRTKIFKRLALLGLLLLAGAIWFASATRAAETGFSVTIDASRAAPRQVEDSTASSLQRDYALAWRSLARALAENRPELLSPAFVGVAKDKLTEVIHQQSRSGLKRRIVDRGHRIQVVFYSVDGSALEMHDTARLEIQWLDGDKVVHSEQATLYYLALMTPGENSWRLRLLENVPGF